MRVSKTAFFTAVKAWDARAVRGMLATAPELAAARDARGRTALHLCAAVPAATSGATPAAAVATARALLQAGLELDAVHEIPDDQEIFPATALWYALARGRNRALVRLFLKAGASPQHCLWPVIWFDEPDLVRLLLAAGSRTTVVFGGETPLHYAARLGRERVVRELIAAGADVAARDAKGRTAAAHARRKRLSRDVLAALGDERAAGAAPDLGRRGRRGRRTGA